MCTVVLFGDYVGSFLGGGIVAMWLDMRLCPFGRLDLLLYMCISGTFHVLPSYGCGIGGLTSVVSGLAWGSVWGGCLFARPGVIVAFLLIFPL